MKKITIILIAVFGFIVVGVGVFALTGLNRQHTSHHYGDYVTIKEATCTEAGIEEAKCIECEKSDTREIAPLGHQYSDFVVLEKATCEKVGLEVSTCTLCHDEIRREIEALKHQYSDFVVLEKATCEKAGLEVSTCTLCHDEIKREIEALGHQYSDYIIDKVATCLESGSKHKTCQNCHEDVVEVISKIDHVMHEHEKVDASCETSGNIAYYDCSLCQKLYVLNEGNYVEILEDAITLAPLGHDYEIDEQLATCITDGYVHKTCKACAKVDNIEIKALGHLWDQELDCTHGHTCTRVGCSEKATALGHDFTTNVTLPTCTEDGYTTYSCSRCDYSHVQDVVQALGHHVTMDDYKLNTTVVGNDGSYCYKEILEAKCDKCSEVLTKEIIVNDHNYVKTITCFATCQKSGTYHYSCNDCDHAYDENYTDSNAHTFDEGILKGTVKEFHCTNTGCTIVKKAIVAKQEAAFDSSTLNETSTIELEKASINIDNETGKQLSGNVTVSASTLTSEEVNGALSKEDKDRIGTSDVYEFQMTANNEAVTNFLGEVVVSIPYDLQPSEDPDNIVIFWILINKDGTTELIAQNTTYANGFVTFTTTHFSYYTVTRLTPAERCEIYGHNLKVTTVNATCLRDGYTVTVCTRCGNNEKEIIKSKGHDLEYKVTDATCTKNGEKVITCKNCIYKQVEVINKLNHSFEVTKDVVPTCLNEGIHEEECKNCHEVKSITLSKVDHAFTLTVTAATCLEGGFTHYDCDTCDLAYDGDYTIALGHDFIETVIPWDCKNDGHTIHNCSRCEESYIDNKITAHHTWDIEEPTCVKGQTCTVCGEAGLSATGVHTLVNEICIVCGYGCTHDYEEVKVLPTCTEDGFITYVCKVCGDSYDGENLPATGHVGTSECEICGAKLNEYEYYQNLISNMLNLDFYVLIKELTIYANSSKMILKDAEAQVKYTEKGLSVRLFANEIMVNGDNTEEQIDGFIIIENNTFMIYSKQIENQSIYEKQFTVFSNFKEFEDYDEITFSYLGEEYLVYQYDLNDLSIDGWDIVILAADAIEKIVIPLLNKLNEEYPTIFARFVKKVMDDFFTVKISENGKCYTFDFEKLLQFNSKVETLKIPALIDYIFGEGVFDSIPSFITSVLNLSIKDISDFIFRFADRAIIVDFVDSIFNATGLNMSLNDILNNEEMMKMTLLNLLQTLGIPELPNFTELLAPFKDITVYDFIEQMTNGIKLGPIVETIINTYKEDIKVSFDLNKEGYLKEFSANVNIKGIVEGSILITHEHTLEADYDSVINKIKDIYTKEVKDKIVKAYLKANNIEVDEEGYFEIETNTYHYDTNYYYDIPGKLVGQSENTLIRVDIYKTYVKKLNINQIRIESISFDCKNVYNIRFETGKSIETIRKSIYKAYCLSNPYSNDDDAFTPIEFTDELIQYLESNEHFRFEDEYEVYDDSKESFRILYNSETGKIYNADSYKEYDNLEYKFTEHQLVLQPEKNVNHTTCAAPSERHYVCSTCEKEFTLYLNIAHGDFTRSIEFNDPEHPNCEEGVRIITKCGHCDYEYSYEQYYHYLYAIENTLELSELGACGGSIISHSCYCGKEKDTDYNIYDCYFDYHFDEYIDEDGNAHEVETRTCSHCGLVKKTDSYSCKTVNGCRTDEIRIDTILFNGKVLFEEKLTNYYENHDYSIVEFEFVNDSNCEHGVFVKKTCEKCGNQYEMYLEYHSMQIIEIIDVGELGACGGVIEKRSCACGECVEYDIDLDCSFDYDYNEFTDELGQKHYVNIKTCRYCGLILTNEELLKATNNPCEMIVNQRTVCSLRGVVLFEREQNASITIHDYEVEHVELFGDSCKDGGIIYYQCKKCSDSYTSRLYDHDLIMDTIYDLRENGAVCEGTLKISTCPCEKYSTYSLDTECDTERKYISPWFDTEGYISKDSYIIRCAVTDPVPCGLSVYICSYYEKEEYSCTAYQKVRIALGYNELTNTFKTEIIINTMNSTSCHNYDNSKKEYTEDGFKVVEYNENCTQCGLGKKDIYYYQNGRCLKEIHVSVSDIYSYRETHYELTENGNLRCIYSLERIVNGEDFERIIERTYTYLEDCYVHVYQISNYNGKIETSEEEYQSHTTSSYYISGKYCTQDIGYITKCIECGKILAEGSIRCSGHNFVQKGSSYECSRCGLESTTGINGSIVLEDLTDSFGNNENYVIGYYNPFGDRFTTYLSFLDKNGDEHFIENVLIIESRNCRAKEINIAQLSNEVEKMGYQLSEIKVKLTFVPLGSDYNLDYAIVLC